MTPKNLKKCLRCKNDLDSEEYISSHGMHRQCFCEEFELEEWKDFESLIARKQGSKDPASQKTSPEKDDLGKKIGSSFFHGQFKKYSAKLDNVHYILKVQENEAPELPDVEYVCNKIAEKLGFKVPKYALIDFYGERKTFVTWNFISNNSKAANLTHIYHFFKENELFDCENLMRIIKEATRSYKDEQIFVRLCMFDALIGNHDRHGRNIGIIEDRTGKRLSPIYDNPSMLGLYSGNLLRAHYEPPPRIECKLADPPTMSAYVAEFSQKGHSTTIKAFHKKINLKSLDKIIQSSDCSDLMKAALSRLIKRRHEELTHAILQEESK